MYYVLDLEALDLLVEQPVRGIFLTLHELKFVGALEEFGESRRQFVAVFE